MFIPDVPLIVGARQSQNQKPGTGTGEAGAKYFGHHMLPVRVYISRELELEVEPKHKPTYSLNKLSTIVRRLPLSFL